ncbi:MAG: hypothetical protein ACKO86_16045 [Dolichospermum sp.]
MLFHNLPDPWEETTTKNPIEFTVKQNGDLTFKGSPSPDIVEELITSFNYQCDQQRRYELEIEQRINKESRMVNLMTIGFLGISFVVCILCFFVSINKSQKGNLNYVAEPIRRTCTY